MRYTITNQASTSNQASDRHLTVSIASMGAELKSFFDHTHNTEYIWQADPNIWAGSAPVLFPIVGRLKNGEYQYNGKSYALAKHGLARTSDFTAEIVSKSEINFTLVSNDETKSHYPFDFRFSVNFRLSGHALHVTYMVRNTGIAPMLFTLGSHPAFSLPLDQHALEDYWIEFEEAESLDCYFLQENLLCETPIKAYLKNEKIILVTSNLFENDALIFKNIRSRRVSLHHKHDGLRFTLAIGDAPHFGIWAKPNAPFMCFEPWFSVDDSVSASGKLADKAGIMQLDAGNTFTTGYKIEI